MHTIYLPKRSEHAHGCQLAWSVPFISADVDEFAASRRVSPDAVAPVPPVVRFCCAVVDHHVVIVPAGHLHAAAATVPVVMVAVVALAV